MQEQLTLFQDQTHASLIHTQAKETELTTRDFSGLKCYDQLMRLGQYSSLMKTLLEQLLMGSSIEKSAIWKVSVTPAGRHLLSLQMPLGHYTKGKGSGWLPTPSGCSNHGKNHVCGRLDEWGGSSNIWRGTEIGKISSPSFEEWMMGFPIGWTELTERETP